MNQALVNEIRLLGGSISDSVWSWIINNGPHGESFTWSQTRSESPGYVGIEHLERIVLEKRTAEKDFAERALKAVKIALLSRNEELLVRAIQISALVGEKEEAIYIGTLTDHDSEVVSKHAKACSFYLKKRLKENGDSREP